MKSRMLAAALILPIILVLAAHGAPASMPSDGAEEWYVDIGNVTGIDAEELIDMALGLPLAEKHALLESYGAVITRITPDASALSGNNPEYSDFGLKWAASSPEGILSPEQLELMKKAKNYLELCLPEEWHVDMGNVTGIDAEELIDMALGLPLAEKHALLESYGAVVTRITPGAGD